MAEVMVTRRLAAILAADIAGYSRLMGQDEAATVRDLKAHQAVVLPLVEQYGGRIIDTAGDGILAEFPSVVNAVECAFQIQTLMAGRNRDVPEDRRMLFRIGINVGDVIYDESRIYGDGINVAARLEGIATPGRICISSKVHEEVAGKRRLEFRDLGHRSLKNIAAPVHVFELDPGSAVIGKRSPASRRLLGSRGLVAAVSIAILGGAGYLLLPWKSTSGNAGAPLLSTAVLPFIASTDSYSSLAENVTQELTSAIERSRSSRVISPERAAQYRSRSTQPVEVGRELNVRYLVQGDLRPLGEGVIASARIVDATTGNQIWNDRVEVAKSPIADPAAEIVSRLTDRVRVALIQAEKRRVAALPRSANSTALELVLRADEAWDREGEEKGAATARALYEEALRHDPNLVDALLGLCATNSSRRYHDPEADTLALMKERDDWTLRAVRVDRDDPRAWAVRAGALMDVGRWDDALAANAEALRIDPYRASAYHSRGFMLIQVARAEDALPLFDKVVAMNPRYEGDAYLHHNRCFAYMTLKRYPEAVASCEKARALGDYWFFALRLMAAYALNGEMAKAAEIRPEVLRRQPKVSIAWIRRMRGGATHPVYLQQREETFIEGLRRAGIPEE
jgi:class 3 adenylate cyclase/TolB-like protein